METERFLHRQRQHDVDLGASHQEWEKGPGILFRVLPNPLKFMNGFYYLHTNGDLIYKPAIVAEDPDYFNSPFVKKVWPVDTTDRCNAWRIVLEALALKCLLPRAKELAAKWDLTFDDLIELFTRTPKGEVSDNMKDGLRIFVREILGMDDDTFWKKVKERLK